MLKARVASTRPLKVLPLTVRVTLSLGLASPPTTPVMAMSAAASAALMTSSAVMLAASVMVGAGGVVSMATVSLPVLPGLPSASV